MLLLLLACANECLEMCQGYEVYLDDCGYGWSTTFNEEGWATIEDCYADFEGASAQEQEACLASSQDLERRACY